MTLWACFSDVHGNRRALERAIHMARQRGAERFAFLGDLLGRGDPDGVIALVRSQADLCVVGNRDLDWADRVSEASRAFVLALPRRADTERFIVVHGDPKLDRQLSISDVRRGAPRIYPHLRATGRAVLLFGHTHHARVWRKQGLAEPLELLDQPRVSLAPRDPSTVFIVNVGTTGLPFPGKGLPSFALLQDDPDTAWVEHVSISKL